jgi:hypothetical protein
VVEPGGKLMDVASGTIMPSQTMHHRDIADHLVKVKLAMVVPEYHNLLPPINLRAQMRTMLWSLGIASVGL